MSPTSDEFRNANDKSPKGVVIGIHAGNPKSGLIWGGFIVLIGIVLLLDHLGVIDVPNLFQFWPTILIVAGLANLCCQSNRLWSWLLIAAGILLELNGLGYIRFGPGELWPALIIVVGVALIWGAINPPTVIKRDGEVTIQRPGDSSSGPNSLNAGAVFGGCERRITSQNFQGGRVSALFGGVELDFRDANIDGDQAVLDIHCIFGGVEIRVPDNWHVHSSSLPILGGYSDKTRLRNVAPTSGSSGVEGTGTPSVKTLIITGTIIFGGLEVSN